MPIYKIQTPANYPRRKHTIFRTRRKFEIKKNSISLPIERSPSYASGLQHDCKALCVSQEEDGTCVWYGQCYTDEKGKVKNCYNIIAPPILSDPIGLEILARRCPYLYDGNGKTNSPVWVSLCLFINAVNYFN